MIFDMLNNLYLHEDETRQPPTSLHIADSGEQRDRQTGTQSVCVCVCERERERERVGQTETEKILHPAWTPRCLLSLACCRRGCRDLARSDHHDPCHVLATGSQTAAEGLYRGVCCPSATATNWSGVTY